MNALRIIGSRIYQRAFWIMLPILPYHDPKIIDDLKKISDVIKKEGKKKPLLVTDKNLIKYDFTKSLIEDLKNSGVEAVIFDEVVPNPTTDLVYAGEKIYKDNNCDCLIAVGGGSPMDTAKTIGARISYPNKPINDMAGVLKVNKKIPLLIAVPTTAGTGSETTLAAVIVDSKTRHKYAINSFPLIPKYACLDSECIHGLPEHIGSSTGMDALTHAVEAYIGKSTTKSTRKDSEDAVKLIFDNIEDSVSHKTKEAEANMLKASYLAGRAFTKSYVGYVHAISHSLSGKYDMPHGLTNAILLPHILRRYGKSVYKPLAKLAIITNLGSANESEETLANKFIDKVFELNKEFNIPYKVKDVDSKDIPEMAKNADHEANPLYPCPVEWDAKELEGIYYDYCECK